MSCSPRNRLSTLESFNHLLLLVLPSWFSLGLSHLSRTHCKRIRTQDTHQTHTYKMATVDSLVTRFPFRLPLQCTYLNAQAASITFLYTTDFTPFRSPSYWLSYFRRHPFPLLPFLHISLSPRPSPLRYQHGLSNDLLPSKQRRARVTRSSSGSAALGPGRLRCCFATEGVDIVISPLFALS